MTSCTLKGARWPSFLLFPAFLFTLFTSVFASYLNYWLGISCLLLLLCFSLPEKFNWSYLSFAVIGFCSLIIANLIFIDTAYIAEEFYYIAFFMVSFVVFNQIKSNQIIYLYRLITGLFICLAIWSLIQYYTGNYYLFPPVGHRSNTIFVTPNTFAAAINMILFPLIAVNLCNRKSLAAFGVMLLLFLILLLTQSRGGLLSFLAGSTVISILCYRLKSYRRLYWRPVLLGFICVYSLFVFSQVYDFNASNNYAAGKNNAGFGLQEDVSKTFKTMRSFDLTDSSGGRRALYQVAWKRISEKPLLGHGYNNFQFYWMKDKPLSRKVRTHFAHNDYLQLWMEIGIFGLITLLSIIALFYYQVWKRFKDSDKHSQVLLLALAGGLSAYFAHAMVDFVMYPCFLMLLFGAYLGTANQLFYSTNSEFLFIKKIKHSVVATNWNMKFWRNFILCLLIVFLSQPYLAELSFKHAEKYFNEGTFGEGLPYYELARRFAPYNESYYVKEGSYWRWIVIHRGDDEKAAQRADQLFEAGAVANPYDVKNILSRAVLNRDYPHLLVNPVSNETILKWFDHVLYWQPALIAGQFEYVNTLYKFGYKKKAYEMIERYIMMNPDSNELIDLKHQLTF